MLWTAPAKSFTGAGIFLILLGSPFCKKVEVAELGMVIAASGPGSYHSPGRNPAKLETLQSIEDGSRLKANKNTIAWLRLKGAGNFRLSGGSRLTIEGNDQQIRLHLERGNLLGSFHPKGGTKLMVTTAHTTVLVTGTVFAVSALAKATNVTVKNGQVRVSSGEKTGGPNAQKLRAGETVQVKAQTFGPPELGPVSEMTSLQELEFQYAALVDFLPVDQILEAQWPALETEILSAEKQIAGRLALMKRRSLQSKTAVLYKKPKLKKDNGRLDKITLYNGRIIIGRFLSRGPLMKIATDEGIIVVYRKDIRSTKVIR